MTINGTSPASPAAGAVASVIATGAAANTAVTATAGADGSYSFRLPIGTYNVIFGSDPNDGFDPSSPVTAAVTAGANITVNGSVAPSNRLNITFTQSGPAGTPVDIAAPPAPLAPGGTPTLYMAGFGKPISIGAVVSGAPANTPLTWSWQLVAPSIPSGISQPPLSLAGAATSALSFTTPKFDSVVWDPSDPTYGNLAFNDLPNVRVPARHQAMAVPTWVETRLTYQLKVTVKAGLLSKSAMVAVRPAMYSAAAAAAKLPGGTATDTIPRYVVPVGQPVIFGAPRFPIVDTSTNARETGTYGWALSGVPAGSSTALDVPDGQFVSFTPDKEGVYTLTSMMKDHLGNSYSAGTAKVGNTTIPGFSPYAPWAVKVVVASYVGWHGTSPNPASVTCTTCHDSTLSGSTAGADYATSKHAELFKQGIDGFQTSSYGASCARCHTTGFSEGHLVQSGGFDDVARATGWTFPTDVADTGTAGSKSGICPSGVAPVNGSCLPAPLESLAAVSCESCHGPGSQHPGKAGESSTAFAGGYIGGQLNDQICLQCHSGSGHYDRGAQLDKSRHHDPTLAILDATLESRGPTALHCGRCHGAGGFAEYLKQAAGVGNGVAPSGNQSAMVVTTAADPTRPTDAEYISFITGKQLTGQIISPQGCTTCHDPHTLKLRTQMVTVGTGAAAAQPWVGGTPVLPAGFAFPGGGKGTLCMACHNTRTGLHDDAHAPIGFTAPHTPSQTDVLAGKNAYYVPAATTRGTLSKHASAADTCVTCHVKIQPGNLALPDGTLVLPAGYVTGSGDNHTFKASAQICASCHAATVDGASLQKDVQLGIDDLAKASTAKLLAVINGYFAADPSGTLAVKAWDRVSDATADGTNGSALVKLGPAGATGYDTTVSNFSGGFNIDTEIHGQLSPCVNLTAPVNVNFGGTVGVKAAVELCFQLGNLAVANTTTVTIVNGGSVGTATFTAAGPAYTTAAPVATAAIHQPTYAFNSLVGSVPYGLQLKFPAGTYVAGDTFTIDFQARTVTAGAGNAGTVKPAVGNVSLLDPSTSPIVRAMWNVYFVRGDGSLGIHNPSFIYDALTGPLPYLQ